MQCNQIRAGGQLKAACYEALYMIYCMPLKVGQGCPIVNMGGPGGRDFPPAASQMAHSPSFVHQSVYKTFCVSILLRYMGGRVVNSNPLPLE